jgi:hypothetical protein
MKVKELIENLSKQDPETEVFFLADDTLIIEDDILALCEVRNIQAKEKLFLKDHFFVDESTLRDVLEIESYSDFADDDFDIDEMVEITPFVEGIIINITAAREGCK